MTIKKLEAQVQRLEAERSSLFEKRKPIDEMIQANYKELEDFRTKLGEAKVKEMVAENFIPSHNNWFSEKELALVLLGETNSMPLHRHAEKLMHERFNYAFSRYGYMPEYNQATFKIALIKGDSARTSFVKDVILYMLPHIKWREKDRYDRDLALKEKRFDIFEHTLSAGGRSFDLVYTENDVWSISSSYHRMDAYPSLDAALKYIEDHLWYERLDKNGKRYDDDDDEDDDDY